MLGLTKQEKGVIIFLTAMAVLGLGLRAVKALKSRVALEVVSSELTPQEQNIEAILRQVRLVNINQDTEEKIITLPGLGPALAGRIVRYRQEHGRFEKAEELMDVSGIGPKKFEKLREFIILESEPAQELRP